MSDDAGHNRRALLRSVGAAAGADALGGVAGATAACDGATESTTRTGSLSSATDGDTFDYETTLADPCELAIVLSSVDTADFDLYLTTDGRTPSTEDYDRRSETAFVSDERITHTGDAVAGGDTVGVLVDAYTASGSYTVGFTETTADEGSNGSPTAEFDVTLSVTDDAGATDTAVRTLTVEADDGGECGGSRETAWVSDRLYGIFGGDTYTYDTRTASPCSVTVTLDGPSGGNFDLYLTTDGRAPTRTDYDARSASSGSQEEVVLTDVGTNSGVGILVDPASGFGEYTVSVEELGD